MYAFSFNIGATVFKTDLKNITCYKNLDYGKVLFFWYLSKGKSYKIDKSILHKYDNYNIYFNNFECYEISLSESYYVVFLSGN
ncbi:hypothetical protein DYQ05_08840 [Treponema pedis]|uniref:Uncharacterized protein n=1 Tax=Treponema pedis str. T A4 TaxID=1291379 RepID=S6A4B8_9SPIR|nr:hypothetical protein TPE_1837 [Treponema pedis str. T A4]QSI05014.1 hypothetical protein DYQ05_08840 [Treponema pedis]